MSSPIIAASVLAADLANIKSELEDVVKAGADWIHIDVMDGRFVPPITFGDNMVRAIRKNCKLFLDVHLMIANPELHIETFAKAGADRIIVHAEATAHAHRLLGMINSHGIKAGIAVNPGTPVSAVFDVLEVCDLVLIMTVNPGWGGQPFIESTLGKISEISAKINSNKHNCLVEVDGGITAETARACVKVGANVLVAGSSIFGNPDRSNAIAALKAHK